MRPSRNNRYKDPTMPTQSFEKFREFLRGKALRATTVRKEIVEAVMSRKGHFHIRPQGCSPEYFAVALKPAEIQAMTEKLAGGS